MFHTGYKISIGLIVLILELVVHE